MISNLDSPSQNKDSFRGLQPRMIGDHRMFHLIFVLLCAECQPQSIQKFSKCDIPFRVMDSNFHTMNTDREEQEDQVMMTFNPHSS
jgi:hypothetical protein